jgi:hypothetical protein
MKRQTFMATAIILISAFIFLGWKKEDAKKDYSSLFKNTVWTGEFNYTGAVAQPFSIEFKEGGQFTWYELKGEFPGTWKIENNKIIISFPGGNGFKADISGENKLTNIQNLQEQNWAVVNAALNPDTEESLDQTTWTTTNIKLYFKAGSKVDIDLGCAGNYYDISYIYKANSFRFSIFSNTYIWFIVRNDKLVSKGINKYVSGPDIYPFQLSKN